MCFFSRLYFLRRIKDAFKENKNVADTAQIQALIGRAQENLDILKRQVISVYSLTPYLQSISTSHGRRVDIR